MKTGQQGFKGKYYKSKLPDGKMQLLWKLNVTSDAGSPCIYKHEPRKPLEDLEFIPDSRNN